MTAGELVDIRIQKKLCVQCGTHPAIDWPYVCPDCQETKTPKKYDDASPGIIDWTCDTCGRTGIAIILRDDPAFPGERAYRAHQSLLAGRPDRPRCATPSLTWSRRR